MITEKMTVHKALAELKILDSRIESAIDAGVYCLANKHSNTKLKGILVEDFKKVMQSSYDKASDLIRRRDAIKRAIVASNAVTPVEIGGVEYTVAVAIEMNNHGMEFKRMLYGAIKKQYNKAQAEILANNGDSLDERAEDYVIGLYGSKEGKTSTEEFDKAKKSFIESNTYELVDPIGVLDKMEKLEKEIDTFTAEVDAALSVSNALTEITIEY